MVGGHPGAGGKRARKTPKGRQVDPEALAQVRTLLGDEPLRRYLLIEYLHRVQDRHGYLSALHLAALNGEMRLSQSEVYEADLPGEEIVFGDGFRTANGRGKLVPARILPPDKLPDEDYPMVLTAGRQLEYWHTGAMSRRAKVLDELRARADGAVPPAWSSSLSVTRRPRPTC